MKIHKRTKFWGTKEKFLLFDKYPILSTLLKTAALQGNSLLPIIRCHKYLSQADDGNKTQNPYVTISLNRFLSTAKLTRFRPNKERPGSFQSSSSRLNEYINCLVFFRVF